MAHDIDRFYAKTQRDGECLVWVGARDRKGYGIFSVRVKPGVWKTVRAARWIYAQTHGPFAEGMEPDHLCSNPPCVRLDHLEAVTRSENTRRGRAAEVRRARMRAACPAGHPYDSVDNRGARICLRCIRDQQAARRVRKKVSA